jgi:S-adenosylmethionine hydrolase
MGGREWTIALLTDFGRRDPYVAAMKGVLLSRCAATIVDLSHEIAPFDPFEAAMFLRFCIAEFPPRTIFVSVVDPGVGSSRKIIVAREGEQFHLAPDNGLLSPILAPEAELLVLGTAFDLTPVSRTFHGRDRFAPAAAALAAGTSFGSLGSPMARESMVKLDYRPPVYDAEQARGSIIAIDRFGNAISDIEAERVAHLQPWRIVVGSTRIEQSVESYADAIEGMPFVIRGSRETIEISIRQQSAAELLQLTRGQSLLVEKVR